MISFRVIRSGVLLSGLLAALGPTMAAVGASFTATLSPAQKTETGLTSLSPTELAALDRLVAADATLRAHLPALTDPYTQRYTESETKEAGLDRLTQEQLVRLDELITSALASSPAPQARERPRVRDGEILSEKGRLQVHGGMSLTMGWASGGRNFREVGAWVSYFDPATGLGLSFGFSRYSGDLLDRSYGGNYYGDTPFLYPAPRTSFATFDRLSLSRNEFAGDGASLRMLSGGLPAGGGFRR